MLNLTRTTVDPTGHRGQAYLLLAEPVTQAVAWFRDYVPGGRRAYLAAVADRVGVRESRRIQGLTTLTREDVLGGRRDRQGIGVGAYPIDIHDPGSPGLSHTDQPRGAYDLPYGILVARDHTNLLAAGRCVSSTHEANGSARITATCFTTGEAAGCAAALASLSGVAAPDLDIRAVQEHLHARGVLGVPGPAKDPQEDS